MSVSKLERFLALPPHEQSMLELFLVVHTPINRTRMAHWLSQAKLAPKGAAGPSAHELKALVDKWLAAGLVTLLGKPDHYLHGYSVHDALRHDLAGRLHDSGKLEPLVQLVRAEEPMFGRYSYYSDPDRLAREIFLAMYLGPSADVEQALLFNRPRRDEDAGELWLRAFGFFTPLARLRTLGIDKAEAYLAYALELATSTLSPVGAGLLEYVRAAAAQLDGRVLASAALYLVLRGEHEQAASLAALGQSPESLSAQSFVELTQGNFAIARRHARAALERTRSKKTKQLKGVGGSLWPWLLLALFTSTDDPEAATLARQQLALSEKKHSEARHVVLHALGLLERFLSVGEPPSHDWARLFDEDASWTDLIVWRLVLRFAGVDLPDTLKSWLGSTRRAALEAGFVGLADELTRLNAEPADGLARMYVPEEPWQRALRALEGAIELANGSTVVAPVSAERLVWTLIPEPDGSAQLTARLQTRTQNGFSSGRQMSWKKLYEADPEARFLGADDRRVLRHLQLVRDQGYPGKSSHVLAPAAVLALIGHPRVFADNECRTPVDVARGDVRIDVQDHAGEVVVSLEPAACLEREVVCRYDGTGRIVVYTLSNEQRIVAQQLSRVGLRLPAAARESAQRVLGKLVNQFALSSELELETPEVAEVPSDSRIHLQLWRAGTGLRVRCCVAPLGTNPTFPAGVGSPNVLGTQIGEDGRTNTVRCVRDLDAELLGLERLWAACPTLAHFEASAHELRIDELTRCLDLLCELRAFGDAAIVEWPEGQALSIVAERDLKDMKLQLRDEASWLRAEGELTIDADLKLSFRQLLEHTRARQGRFVALDDGRFVALSESLQRSLDGALALSRVRGDQLELHPLALLGVTRLNEATLDSDSLISSRLQRAREAAELVPEVPHTLEASLRPYQVEGYAFLSRLAHWGAGACLADDMGLGKTLQTLALLVEHAPRGPSLVVAPTSVCANWLDEARKFAPSLRVVQLRTGSREQVLRELAPFDVLVCSYGVLQQERERLSATRFQVVVLDEAQAIKNASTHRAKAATELVSNVRIALTGTPIENHLGELWSILSFVNPGLLGTAKSFEERFVRPIQRDGDRQAAQLLRRIIAPFVLRRRKSEVLDDLPEKTVVTLRVEPSAEERALFAALREQALARLSTSDKPAEARIRLLAELTRMRRAACHPDLVMPTANIASSKLATLEALLLELRQGGHRVLIFSQFVDYLTIVRGRMEAIGVTYQYLDGSSSTPARAASVTAFQAGESDVFLISLRAGGFGLNLTAADYVIHLDPWWNPAVEDQASDRAHRIGQTRPVTIYRLVMEGSIEEKILALHTVKRELADDLLSGTGTAQALGVDELMDLLSEANAELSPTRGTRDARSAE